MNLSLHNTLTGKKEVFTPLKAGHVGLYVCGITPYDEAHIGHARCYVVFDILKRVLKSRHYKVLHIQNFTDVDDKIIERANALKKNPFDYPKPFMDSFKKYMGQLNVEPPDQYPLVTTHMDEIVKLIQKLMDQGYSYVIDGDVYYSVRKFGDKYVELSKRKLDELDVGARVQVDERKKDPLDFALWKKAKEGEPAWDSPWGKGRPGWHIECSAMAMKYLGETFDIHGGGLDLVFPHHTNEIAQSEGASGKTFANVWIHNGFVTVDDEKMSKSLGNFFTLKDILSKYDPMVVRYFLLSQHYQSPLNFSDQALEGAKTAWTQRILGAYRIAEEWERKIKGWDKAKQPNASGYINQNFLLFEDALSDDLNTPKALAEINNVCATIYLMDSKSMGSDHVEYGLFGALKGALEKMFHILGLVLPGATSWPSDVLALANDRETARRNRDWKRSDELRDALKKHGVVVEDTPAGPRLKKIP